MADVTLFRPRAELDAAGNLARFVTTCREELEIFGSDLDFDSDGWDITDSLDLQGHGGKRHRLIFNALVVEPGQSERPMSDRFRSFAKAYMRYMHGFRPTKIVGFRLAALRVLEIALSENGLDPSPILTDAHVLNRAAQIVVDRYSEAAAYRIGGQLEMVSQFLVENRLTVSLTSWRNPIKRPGSSIRVGKEFDARREEKMPSEAALDALPKVFRLAVEPVDIIVSSIAALLCSSPDRISEVLTLPVRCEVNQNAGNGKADAYGLRWRPAKGADPMVKWIVPSMVGVAEEAINKIRSITRDARKIAKWYEENSSQIYLHDDVCHLRTSEWLTMDEVAEIIGFGSVSSARIWCNQHELQWTLRGKLQGVNFVDVQSAILAMLPKNFPFLDKKIGLKYSDALMVIQTNQLGTQRETYRCMIEPISINQINTGLGSRVEFGFASIFSRLGFTEPDGSPIKVTTHQFRHYLNTLAQAGGMSQLDIAKWSGRKDIRQNAAYDHVTPDQMLLKIREAVGDKSQMFGPLAEIPKKVLIPRDEFARLRIPTAHTTDLGFCVHDYTMSPCQLHRDCVHCEDLVCIKGDESKMNHLRRNLEEAREMLRKAEEAVGEDYAGADRWLVHHQSTVDRLSQLWSIMDDPNVPYGAVIQLKPPDMVNNLNPTSAYGTLREGPTEQSKKRSSDTKALRRE